MVLHCASFQELSIHMLWFPKRFDPGQGEQGIGSATHECINTDQIYFWIVMPRTVALTQYNHTCGATSFTKRMAVFEQHCGSCILTALGKTFQDAVLAEMIFNAPQISNEVIAHINFWAFFYEVFKNVHDVPSMLNGSSRQHSEPLSPMEGNFSAVYLLSRLWILFIQIYLN